MSVFDPTSLIISGADAAVDAIIDALKDELPLKFYEVSTTGASTASGTAVSLLLQSRAIEADELVIFTSQTNISCGTLNDRANVTHFINGTTINNWSYWYGLVAETGGKTTTLYNMSFAENLSGTIDFDVKWNVETGSGTIYSNKCISQVRIFKKR